MAENDPNKREGNTRLGPVQNTLLRALRRCQDLGKLMVDPLDVLTCVIEDASVQQLLTETGIDIVQLREEIVREDSRTPQGETARDFARMLNIEPGNGRSFVLDHSIQAALRIADGEGGCDVTNLHLLAGILRQGTNVGAEVFRRLDLTQDQYHILARSSRGE